MSNDTNEGRTRRRGRPSPFRPVAPALVFAGIHLGVAVAWLVQDSPPGGRWTLVHLFTLGALTLVVMAFTRHFSATLTRAKDGDAGPALYVAAVAGALTLFLGLPYGREWLVAAGSTVVTAAVLANYLAIRRMRKAAVGARFTWVVRIYERVHGAFVHGALLGALMGTRVLSGPWYLSARYAHMHVNVLGFGVVTVLATVPFFGPTLQRVQIEPGADDRAARWLRHGVTGVTVGVLVLLASGVGGTLGTALRLVSAVGLALLAAAAAVIVPPVVRGVRRTKYPGPSALLVGTAAAWLLLGLWADVAVVAAGRWRLLDAVGAAVILGALLQAMVATAAYVVPNMLRRRPATGRVGTVSAIVYNLGVAAVFATAIAGAGAADTGSLVARAGWTLTGIGAILAVGSGFVGARLRRREAG